VSPFAIPVRRPVATAMFFLAILLLGLVGWQRMPVELFPQTEGNQLNVRFNRPGSEPEVVEREILLPLEAKVAELSRVMETSGEIRGSGGSFVVKFEPGVDIDVRELELSRLAADLQREQPQGTFINVQLDPFTQLSNSRFAMYLQVTGMSDVNALLDFVEDRIVPRLAAVGGVAQVQAFGGSPRELTVSIDPDLCAAEGINTGEVTQALAKSVRGLDYLGGVEDEAGRTAVLIDGRPKGEVSLASIRIRPDRAVLLRHVADVELGTGREQNLFRVDGQPAIGLILYQEEGANLVQLADDLRGRLDSLTGQFSEFGIGFRVLFDGGELIEDQLDRLKKLAFSGFIISLVTLYLFLRHWRAVGVVAIAVPCSLLTALALLYTAGQTLNVVTLLGLAVGIGMLVDNSIVVYEAVQRQLEHGASGEKAAENGVRRTVRAILAATATNAVVFLPIVFVDFDDASLRSFLTVLVIAILVPLLASVIVAIGLVPMLAGKLAAPAAMQRLKEIRARRERFGGLVHPDRARGLANGALMTALRRPGSWVAIVLVAVVISFIQLVGLNIGGSSQEAQEQTQIRLPVTIEGGGSLDAATDIFAALESSVMDLEGIERVESFVQEEGGSITVTIPEREERPDELTAARVRERLRDAANRYPNVELSASQGGGGGGGRPSFLGGGASRVVVSGPDVRRLRTLTETIKDQLEEIPDIGSVTIATRDGQDEMHVLPDATRLQAFGLTADQVLPVLNVVGREGTEMRTGFTLRDGREIPLTVRRKEARNKATNDLRTMRVTTPFGALPLSAFADVRQMGRPPTISHRDGRREVEVLYTLASSAPEAGAERTALEDAIRDVIHQTHRPVGYTIEAPQDEEGLDWFNELMIPILLLLYAVLAITFESLTLPLLVLLSIPLTVLGATWTLTFSQVPVDQMALFGVVALIGITVNPAILLVDRMQQATRFAGRPAGAAALRAVRERTRPVLMTAATTILGLWPLAIVTGEENEIWPPFATVIMGGLTASTVLTLLVIPVGFVFLNRLDRIFGRLGPWIAMGWLLATAAVVTPLFAGGWITSVWMRLLTTILVAGALLAVAVLAFRRQDVPKPRSEDGPPKLETRYLNKIYGQPGPIGRAWRAPQRFVERVRALGVQPFDPRLILSSIVPRVLIAAGALYLGVTLQSVFWRMIYLLIASFVLAGAVRQLRRARGKLDQSGRVDPGGIEGWVATSLPWAVMIYLLLKFTWNPFVADFDGQMATGVWVFEAIVLAICQFGRRTAVLLHRGDIALRPVDVFMAGVRGLWRSICRVTFGFDLPSEQVHAIRSVKFEAQQGMIGVLGPNGAGKTTLLRMLSGILEPSSGTVYLGGVRLLRLRRFLARWIGYLPQDFGLPEDMTAREYLEYFALLYELPAERRTERIERLLTEVGLGERADEKIGGFSGGMKQRVAVARTLLRLPPVIIVDEPTVGLDPRERIRFRNLLARLAEGRVVLFSTHVVEDVEVACGRVIVFTRGRIVFDGPPERLSDAARNRVWMATLQPGDEEKLPAGALVVDQVPEASGAYRTRILAEGQPAADAEPVDPGLEDGYLWLVGDRATT